MEEYTIYDYIAGYGINIVLPILGVLLFLVVNGKMYEILQEYSPTVGLFLIFACYGGILWGGLTSIFWKYSGMAGIGFAFMIGILPIASIAYYIKFHKMSSESRYHHWILKGLIAYPLIIFLFILIALTIH